VERGPFGAPGSLRSPMLSGRALKRALGERHTHPVKRPTQTPCPTGAPPRAAPTVSRRRTPRKAALRAAAPT